MTKQTLTLMIHPSALINANSRMVWQQKARMTRSLRGLAHAEAKVQGLKPVTGRQHVTVVFSFLTHAKRDVGNLAPTTKAIIDGLTDAGIWPDDNDVYVEGPDHRNSNALSIDCVNQPDRKLRRVAVTVILEDVADERRRERQMAAAVDLAAWARGGDAA